MVTIIDYDIGNIYAIVNMLNRLGIACNIANCSKDIENSQRIILPGNGSFDACMRNLRKSSLIASLEEMVLIRGVPILGICVGAQILGKNSEEGTEAGLGWVDMEVKRFPILDGLRVPHMGWNKVHTENIGQPILEGIDNYTRYYFNHSYYMVPKNHSNILFSTSYRINFVSAVLKDNIIGVQFHPEKSHRFGKQFLNNFVARF